MKVSLITTVYNEEDNIESFLESIFNMSILPDEIIVVDAGSKDKTVDILHKFSERYNIKIIIKENCNIAEGRNIAIKNSSNDIIAVTDAGCEISKEWLKNITEPFNDENIKVVSGWYEPLIKNNFEKYTAPLLFIGIDEVNSKEFLPSSRSIAFRKEIFKKVGGYPEFLTFAGEDTLFDLKLKKYAEFYFAKKAIVYWEPRKDLKSFIKQIILYSIGDGEANIFEKIYIKKFVEILIQVILTILTITTYNMYFFVALIILLVLKYKRILIKNTNTAFFTIPIFFIMEICQVIGFIKGTTRRNIVNKSKRYLEELNL